MHFRDRLASTLGGTSGQEALLDMRKRGSFLFREFKVPSSSEIAAARQSSQQQASAVARPSNFRSLAIPGILRLAPSESSRVAPEVTEQARKQILTADVSREVVE
jgi:hypothetical protein